MERFLFIFEGTVQGVGFRISLVRYAEKYHLTGYCRNLANGMVEAVFQGDRETIFAHLDELKNNCWINIESYTYKKLPVDPDLKQFDVIF